MDIAWLGHAAFRLRGRDAAVVTDPCPGKTGFKLNRPQADVVTVSNPDPAYSWVEGVGGDPRELAAPGEFEIKHVLLTGVVTPGAEEQRNLAFVITIDDVIIAHLGDLRSEPSSAAIEELSRAQVFLVPVGGHGHLSGKAAANVLSSMEPKLIIPMLYKVKPEKEALDGVKEFVDAMSAGTSKATDNHVNVTPTSLPDTPTVELLLPRGA